MRASLSGIPHNGVVQMMHSHVPSPFLIVAALALSFSVRFFPLYRATPNPPVFFGRTRWRGGRRRGRGWERRSDSRSRWGRRPGQRLPKPSPLQAEARGTLKVGLPLSKVARRHFWARFPPFAPLLTLFAIDGASWASMFVFADVLPRCLLRCRRCRKRRLRVDLARGCHTSASRTHKKAPGKRN